MLDFHEVNFGVRTRENIGQISSVKPKETICLVTVSVAEVRSDIKITKKTHTHICDVNNTEVALTSSSLSLLNLMLRYIFSRIPGKHKSTLKFFKYI